MIFLSNWKYLIQPPRLTLLSLSFLCQKSSVTGFRVNITESGTKFNEKLEVDTKEDTEVFHIPKHNNVDQSDIMHMFALVGN